MTPTETLKHEHKIALLILNAAEREARSIQETGSASGINVDKIETMVDFFRNFIDKCHHTKEERHLFPRMQERGMTHVNEPVSVMLYEHEEGRRRVQAIAGALLQVRNGVPSATASLSNNLLAYIELLRAHIGKEDNVLFPLADKLFTPEDQQSLNEAFEKVEAEEIGEGVHEKYHQLAHDLAKN
jgi:hemerythrin-like domain-containing protein